jgi:hypothetical protein
MIDSCCLASSFVVVLQVTAAVTSSSQVIGNKFPERRKKENLQLSDQLLITP